MKKVLAILCSAALALSLFNGVYAEERVNLALAGTAITDSVSASYSQHSTDLLNDGDYNTRWQSNKEMAENGEQSDDLAPWCGIYWEEAKTVASIALWSEASDPAINGFDIYYAAEYAGDATVWTEITDFIAVRDTNNCGGDNSSDNDSTDWINFAPVDAEAIKVVGRTRENKNQYLSVWELEVFGEAENLAAETAVNEGVKDVFVATDIAEADLDAGEVIKAEYTITKADGTSASGASYITSAYNRITLGTLTFYHSTDYVTGIKFTNVPEDATIDVTFSIAVEE